MPSDGAYEETRSHLDLTEKQGAKPNRTQRHQSDMNGSLQNQKESTAASKKENKPSQNPTSNKIEKRMEKKTVDLTIRYFPPKTNTDLKRKAKLFQPKSPSKWVPIATRQTYAKLEGNLSRLGPALALTEPPRAGHRRNSNSKELERMRRNQRKEREKKYPVAYRKFSSRLNKLFGIIFL
ncbi:hypothetical protein Bca4012_017373 [Brassica carinata]